MSGVENPAAFPLVATGDFQFAHDGMTLRDWFAGQAIQYIGKRKDIQLRDAKHIAALSYELADALLAARQNGGAA